MEAPSADRSILLVDDDELLADSLAELLGIEAWSVMVCHDLEGAQLLLERRLQPVCVVTDLRLTSQFAAEGFDLIRSVKLVAPDACVIAMSADVDLEEESLRAGANRFLLKPFDVGQLVAILDQAGLEASRAAQVSIMPSIDAVITSGRLVPHYQPIVDLAHHRVFAFEALIRFDTTSPLRSPDLLFDYAARKGRAAALDLACMERALAEASGVIGAAKLFLNIHPASFADPDPLVKLLTASSLGFPAGQLVLELTEHTPIRHVEIAANALRLLRSAGVAVALDDIGAAHSHLALMSEIDPSFVKIGDPFSAEIDSDASKRRVVSAMVALARELGAEVVLETIENVSTASRARDIGITYGQGYFFGRPSPAMQRHAA